MNFTHKRAFLDGVKTGLEQAADLDNIKISIAIDALDMMCSNDTDSLWKAKEIGRTALNKIKGETK